MKLCSYTACTDCDGSGPFQLSNGLPDGKLGKIGHFEGGFSFAIPNTLMLDESDSFGRTLNRLMDGCYIKMQTSKMALSIILAKESSMDQNTVQLFEKGTFLKDLINIFGEGNVGVKITLSGPRIKIYEAGGQSFVIDVTGSFSTKEMIITRHEEITCEDIAVQLPNLRWRNLFQKNDLKFSCSLTVEVFVSNMSSLSRLTPSGGNMVAYKKMLHDEVHSDVVIIAGDGEGDPIKCHKSVLSASSPVFETMFKTDMQELKTHRIEIADMTEEGVRAFLAYIYYSDLKGPNDDSGIAYEMLRAAHKYQMISGLESEIIKIFLAKPVEWLEVEYAMKLFAFARNLPSGQELKIKAVQVLKRNFEGLPQSETYKEMFQKDPAAAMELCQLSFSI